MEFQKISVPSPAAPTHGGQRKFRGKGGIQKEAISEGVGLATRVFFPGAPSTIDEQDISYFIFNQCSKAKIIFSSMIFYLPLAECVFFTFTACTIVYCFM